MSTSTQAGALQARRSCLGGAMPRRCLSEAQRQFHTNASRRQVEFDGETGIAAHGSGGRRLRTVADRLGKGPTVCIVEP